MLDLPEESPYVLTGNAFKVLYVTARSAEPLTIEDYPMLVNLNRETVLISISFCIEQGYIQRTKRGRKFLFHFALRARQVTMHLPSLSLQTTDGTIGNPDSLIVGISDSSKGQQDQTIGFSDSSKESYRFLELPKESPGNSTPAVGISDSSQVYKNPEWIVQTERLAEYSLALTGDDPNSQSRGLHIKIWNHARRADKQRRNNVLVDGLRLILVELEQRKRHGKPTQKLGAAFNNLARELFAANDCPLPTAAESAKLNAMSKEIRERYG